MKTASSDFKRRIADNSKVLAKAKLTFADGTTRTLSGDDFVLGGLTFSDSTSSAGSFDIGAAVIGSCEVVLNNCDGRFSRCDFTGAVIEPSIGVELDGGLVEWLDEGVYNVDQPSSYGPTISLSALDDLVLLEKPYSEVPTQYPATLGRIALDLFGACGVELVASDFPNADYVVAERPDDARLTCLAMASYVAQAACCWVRCDRWGRAYLSWYDVSAFADEGRLDGMRFDPDSPYSSGDAADGGTLADYATGDEASGGWFSTSPVHMVHAASNSTVCTDDVVVTGIRVTASADPDGEAGEACGESYLVGEEGYVLEVADNPLVLYGQAEAVAGRVAAHALGMRFRPLDVSLVGDPTIEAGDALVFVDASQSAFQTFVTSVCYKANAYQTVKCAAETPSRNSGASYTAATKAAQAAVEAVRREGNARSRAVAGLASQLASSSGLFMTTEAQSDGSTVYYMHDKRALADSGVVWKMTADAFGVSTDGGRTYPYGLDATGAAVLNRIYTIGLDATYITTGRIDSTNGSHWDLNAGEFQTVFVTGETSNSAGGTEYIVLVEMNEETPFDICTARRTFSLLNGAKIYGEITAKSSVGGIVFDDGKAYLRMSRLGTSNTEYATFGTSMADHTMTEMTLMSSGSQVFKTKALGYRTEFYDAANCFLSASSSTVPSNRNLMIGPPENGTLQLSSNSYLFLGYTTGGDGTLILEADLSQKCELKLNPSYFSASVDSTHYLTLWEGTDMLEVRCGSSGFRFHNGSFSYQSYEE